MRIIFSLNTDIINVLSTRTDVFEVVMKQYYLAIMKAKEYYNDVVLYTDKVGQDIFKDLCEIKLLDKNDSYLFSEAKVETISKESVPFIHIDGDLFITDKLRYFNNIDLLVDHNDNNIWESYYKSTVEKLTLDIQNFPEWGKPNKLFCMGIAGFFNDNLKNLFIERYYSTKEAYLKNKNNYYSLAPIVIEQYPLAVITQYHNFKFEFADNKNKYLHLYGRQKFYKKNIDWIHSESLKYKSYLKFLKTLDEYDKNSVVFRHFTSFE